MISFLYEMLNEAYGISETPLRLLYFTTSRMVLAFLTSFLVVFLISPKVIAFLYRRGMRDRVREYGDNFGQSKSGTPTMGGLILIAGLLSSAVLWCDHRERAVSLLTMTVLFFGGIGAIDDILKITRGSSDLGLSRRTKLLLQLLFASLFALLVLHPGTSPFPEGMRTQLFLPGIPLHVIAPPDLGGAYALVIILAFLGISNAINFADGLDGLAIVPACMTALVFGVYAYMFSHLWFASLVDFPRVQWMNELTVFSAAFLGTGLGFLWFNSYPAQVIMGDTGSMALGGTLAAMAILTKTELLFLLTGGIFVYEFLSVLIQDYVGIQRIGRRMIFRAPAHHGFQHQGVAETKVVLRFWIVSFLLGLLSLATLKLR